jgi:hypothetical protein
VKAVCADVARAQEGEAVPGDYAELVDSHLLPAINNVLNASSGNADQLRDALNELARAHADTLLR